jgi:hypothetical protein
MNISQLLHELSMIPNVEVVVALLPEVLGFANQPPRNSLLEGLDGIGERSVCFLPTQAKRRLEWGTVQERWKPSGAHFLVISEGGFWFY